MLRLTKAPSSRVLYHEISERIFTAQVIELAQRCGWLVAHFRPAMTTKGWRTAVQGDGAGFPDLVLSRDGQVIFAELKSGKGKLSPEQERWLYSLGRCAISVRAVVWRPSDIDEIERTLKGLTEGNGVLHA